MNNELYEYLRISSGESSTVMYRQLERSRRLGIKWEGVPEGREAFEAGLEELARLGLAKKGDNGVWFWLPKVRQESKPQPQLTMF